MPKNHPSNWSTAKPDWVGGPEVWRAVDQRIVRSILLQTARGKMILDLMDRCTKRHPCGFPYCPNCYDRELVKEQVRMLDRFGDVAGSNLFQVTILIDVVDTGVWDTLPPWERFVRKMRNLHQTELKDLDVRLTGFGEWDHFDVDAIREITAAKSGRGARTRRYFDSVGFDFSFPEPAWLIHAHAIMDIPNKQKKLVRDALGRRFPHTYQVDLRPLVDPTEVAFELRNMTAYQLKQIPRSRTYRPGSERKHGKRIPPEQLLDYVDLLNDLKVQGRRFSCGTNTPRA